MLPSLGMFEMIVIGLIAIIVVGPKDLPVMMRKVGQFVRKIRELGNEFKSAFDDIGRETELSELRKEINDLKSLGKIGDFSDKAFEDEMRRLDADIRSDVKGEHPRVQTPAPVVKSDPVIAAPKPKAKPKPKAAPKAKAKPAVKKTPVKKAAVKSKPKTTTKSKPKPKPKSTKASGGKA